MKVEGTQTIATSQDGDYRFAAPSIEQGGSTTTIDIEVELLPEGVFLGTSPDVPGLTVEATTRDEMIKEARATALALLDLQKEAPTGRLRFRFIEFG